MADIWNVTRKVMDTEVTKCTCGFQGYKGHKGADLIPKSVNETPLVLAYDDGVVWHTGNVYGKQTKGIAACGTYVAIRHADYTVTRYQHLMYGSLMVQPGDKVKRGQPIARYGRPGTGNVTGPHLHWDISYPSKPNTDYIKDKFFDEVRFYVDPKPFLCGTANVAAATHKVKKAVNIRKGPGTQYELIGEYQKGKLVTVLEEQNGWCRTADGWVAGNYLKKI